ncbi:MiaB/RimO family radical SAM methylthiotransferase [Desulfovibrio ferrophilus]|uniref:RNA modification enzyme, MiaB family n=1 Tax=Desulfovibrio ferrophilus TaxID=241368 RepID=A0A2Z6AVE9_9BACT|nr:MiaB/RimO family radical SAM methylthiotransferase [Desulfovibrio ferrophilus]BBD07156.1 RNA modification enzyme, MiaB family [Desulfovibrio ferrophilus]
MNQTTRFHIYTLGCKINQYESQSIREAWTTRGCVEASDPANADVIVVNSCAVTAKAVADLRAAVRRFGRQNPNAEVVITGCAAQVLAEELSEAFPDTAIIPQSEKETLLTRPLPMASVQPDHTSQADGSAQITSAPTSDHDSGCPSFPEFSIKGSNRVRAVVKVQDGCTHRCTYCIIPSTRGKAVSRAPEAAVAEVHRLFEAGWREVTLSGINLRQFGRDLTPAMDFWDLLQIMDAELAPQWAGRARLRISSVDPGQLGTKALEVLGASQLICPQLHLSLQSLAPAVLRRMGRGHYGPEDIVDFTTQLGSVWPVFGLGADLLVGFPGETDEDFEITRQYCEKLPLSYAHVFPYSRRPGTPAANYPDQIPHAVKKQRAKILRDMMATKKAAFMQRLTTLDRLDVVVEGGDPAHGICEYYADCRFTDGTNPAPGGLTAASPVSCGKDYVDVSALVI